MKFMKVTRVFHGNDVSHRNWYEVYHTQGAYWAKFELISGKKYAKTPHQIIKWILGDHFKYKIKKKY